MLRGLKACGFLSAFRETRPSQPVGSQKAQARMAPATLRMYGLDGRHRATDTAPETPSSATVQGPMQHRPTNDANMLKPTALPPEARIFFLSCIYKSLGNAPCKVRLWVISGEATARDRQFAGNRHSKPRRRRWRANRRWGRRLTANQIHVHRMGPQRWQR